MFGSVAFSSVSTAARCVCVSDRDESVSITQTEAQAELCVCVSDSDESVSITQTDAHKQNTALSIDTALAQHAG